MCHFHRHLAHDDRAHLMKYMLQRSTMNCGEAVVRSINKKSWNVGLINTVTMPDNNCHLACGH